MMGFWQKLFRGFHRQPTVLPPAVEQAEVDAVLNAFQKTIAISFNQPQLLQRALTHRSFLGGESVNLPASNERLEFLGDAVLELIVIDHLFRQYPDEREGELTQMKSLLVSKTVLADCAEAMNLGNFILLSQAERESGGGERQSILADTFEAILGALYLDGGISSAKEFVHRWLLEQSNKILQDTEKQNFKSILQERVQAQLRVHPRYRVISEKGPDHHKQFAIQVVVKGQVLGTGRGRNKKEAEQRAAREALDSEKLSGLLADIE
jgi:ribonuclease III